MILHMGWDLNLDSWKPRPFRRECIPPSRNGLPQEFGDKPFFLEIGAGTGRHAVSFAQQNPCENIVAIERTTTKSCKASNLVARVQATSPRPGLENLAMFQDDALNWVAHHVGRSCLNGVFILYPNPYPKPSQRKKRFHFMPFMQALVEGLVPRGTITLATNDPRYFLETLVVLPRYYDLEILSQRVCDPRRTPRSNFEELFFQLHVLCYEVVLRRI
jgi:tRNA (guanine-N7-)-methyltransferase